MASACDTCSVINCEGICDTCKKPLVERPMDCKFGRGCPKECGVMEPEPDRSDDE